MLVIFASLIAILTSPIGCQSVNDTCEDKDTTNCLNAVGSILNLYNDTEYVCQNLTMFMTNDCCKTKDCLCFGNGCQEINECDSNPCQNCGECQNGENTFTCICPPGFTGVNCEQIEVAKRDCQISPWFAWGECTSSCGSQGISQRSRTVQVQPTEDGLPCPVLSETKPCVCGVAPLMKLYSSRRTDHFYTISTSERAAKESAGYSYIGIEGNVYTSNDTQLCPCLSNLNPLYKLLKTAGRDYNHHYIANSYWRDSAIKGGYNYLGIEGFCSPVAGRCGMATPLRRAFSASKFDHYYSVSGPQSPDFSYNDEASICFVC